MLSIASQTSQLPSSSGGAQSDRASPGHAPPSESEPREPLLVPALSLSGGDAPFICNWAATRQAPSRPDGAVSSVFISRTSRRVEGLGSGVRKAEVVPERAGSGLPPPSSQEPPDPLFGVRDGDKASACKPTLSSTSVLTAPSSPPNTEETSKNLGVGHRRDALPEEPARAVSPGHKEVL